MAGSDGLPAMRGVGSDVLLKVRAAPGASRDRVVGLHGDALKVAVAAPPEKGKANLAIARLLASALGLSPAHVRLDSGAASRDKWFRIEGAPLEAARRLVRKCLEA
jgi:uncharacterized protein